MPQTPNLREKLRAAVDSAAAALWVTVFAWVCVTGSTLSAWPLVDVLGLAAAGFLIVLLQVPQEGMQRIARAHRSTFASAAAVAALVLASELFTMWTSRAPLHALPAQPGLLLCLLPLAALLADERRRAAVILAFGAVTLWHFVALPVEAVTGVKASSHAPLQPREAGPFRFQASGLAAQSYLFPGFFLPLFWVVWGALRERFSRVPRWAWIALAFAWVFIAACVQSRSALLGAGAAALLALVWERRARGVALAWPALAVVVGGLAYAALFADNKSGGGLRWAYFQHYIAASFDALLLTGHGVWVPPRPAMLVPGLQPLTHSHNDLAQVLYSWGLVAAVAYLAFLFTVVRQALRLAAAGRCWALCATVTVLPSMVSDLGLHHFEKAAFLVWLAAFCMTASDDLGKLHRDHRG